MRGGRRKVMAFVVGLMRIGSLPLHGLVMDDNGGKSHDAKGELVVALGG